MVPHTIRFLFCVIALLVNLRAKRSLSIPYKRAILVFHIRTSGSTRVVIPITLTLLAKIRKLIFRRNGERTYEERYIYLFQVYLHSLCIFSFLRDIEIRHPKHFFLIPILGGCSVCVVLLLVSATTQQLAALR